MFDDDNPVDENEVLPTQEPEADEPESELDVEEALEPVEEEIEIDRAGKKYRIPKALEPELLMQADYTRKTQSLADERKAFDGTKAQFAKEVENQQAFIQDFAKLHAVNDRIQAYEKLNWSEIEAKNPTEAQRLFREYSLLKSGRDELGRDLAQRQQQRQYEEQQETAKRIEQGRAILAQRLPDLTPEKYQSLVDFGVKAFGFTNEELGSIQDPRAVETLHWAQIGKQLYEKARAAPSKQQQPAAQPVPQVNSRRAAPETDLYRIKDPDQWAKVRNDQIAKQRRAAR